MIKGRRKIFQLKNHDKKCKKASFNKNSVLKETFLLNAKFIQPKKSNLNYWKVLILIFLVPCSVVVLDEQQYQNQG